MAALIFSLALAIAVLVLHLAWWRWRPPMRHTRALLGLFATAPVAAGAVGWIAGTRFGLAWADLPGVGLLYGGIALCYLIAYAGVEETSPSLAIVRALEQAGPSGCTQEDLGRAITAERFINPRLEALQRGGLIMRSGGTVALTPVGRRVARLTARFACLFSLDEGG